MQRKIIHPFNCFVNFVCLKNTETIEEIINPITIWVMNGEIESFVGVPLCCILSKLKNKL